MFDNIDRKELYWILVIMAVFIVIAYLLGMWLNSL